MMCDWMRDSFRANTDVSGRLKAHWNACTWYVSLSMAI